MTKKNDYNYFELLNKALVGIGECPSSEDLRNLALGKLTKNKFTKYKNHVLICDTCYINFLKLKDLNPLIKFGNLEVFFTKLEKQYEKESWSIPKLKQLAKKFIKEKYPYELPFFKMAWNALKDIQDFSFASPKALMSALSITGAENEEELITPIAIITTIRTFRELSEQINKIEKTELISKIKKIAIRNKASEDLATELSEYIAKNVYESRNKD